MAVTLSLPRVTWSSPGSAPRPTILIRAIRHIPGDPRESDETDYAYELAYDRYAVEGGEFPPEPELDAEPHLESAVYDPDRAPEIGDWFLPTATALPDGTFLLLPRLVPAALFPAVRSVEEGSGCHVVPLGGDRVLITASAPRTARLIEDLGFTPVVADIIEFEKLEGCVTCLSVMLPAR